MSSAFSPRIKGNPNKKKDKVNHLNEIKKNALKLVMSPSIAISILSPGKVVTDIEVNLLSDIFGKFIHEVKYDEGKDGKDIITFESYEDGPKRDVTRSLVLEEAEKGKYIVKSVNNDKENGIRVIETKGFGFEDVSNPFYRNSTK